jgi:CheY-like chemotaxis protein/HPt (histidine-containing phosphotransfer) domain-containing protein
MDGEVLGRVIAAEPRFSDLRMVMLTSMGVRGDARRLADLGFSGYLTKPVRPRELQGVLSLSLAGKAPDIEPPLVTRHQVLEQAHRFDGGDSRILLVEDNVTNQQVVQGMLERLGLSADVVSNGRAAIEALDRHAYDLVLMDCQMPVMDGFEATRQIRRQGHSDLPIIALTAHAMQGDREICLAAGMNDYLTKPLSTQALVAALKTWLPDTVMPEGVSVSPGADAPVRGKTPPVWNRQAMLERLDGDEQLAETIVGSFLSDVSDQLKHLDAMLRAGDVTGAERQAHTLAGAAAIVGGEEVETLSKAMEIALREHRLDNPHKALQDVKDACLRLKKALNDQAET